jgi:hypothetical protein
LYSRPSGPTAVTCVTYSPDFAQEVPRVAGQNDNAARWICLEIFRLESRAQADVKDAGNHRVNSILRVLMRHKLHARRNLDPDQVRSGLSGLSNKHGQPRRRRKRRERFPIDIFREKRFENVFAWLVVSNHCGAPNVLHHLAGALRPVRVAVDERVDHMSGTGHTPHCRRNSHELWRSDAEQCID